MTERRRSDPPQRSAAPASSVFTVAKTAPRRHAAAANDNRSRKVLRVDWRALGLAVAALAIILVLWLIAGS